MKTRKDFIPQIDDENNNGIFQVMCSGVTLRRDSPVYTYIPKEIWNWRYKYQTQWDICWDVDEAIWCSVISPQHLQAIMEWRDENNERVEVDLS